MKKKTNNEGSASDVARDELLALAKKTRSGDKACVEQLRLLLARLSPAEEQVLRMRFGIGQKAAYPRVQVAEKFDVPLRAIEEIETRALTKPAGFLGLAM